MTRCRMRAVCAALLMLSLAGADLAQAQDQARAQDAPPPLSASQTALFDTPHLQAITRPEVLSYRIERTGPDALTDTVLVHVRKIHPDGSKYVSFDFMTGDHQIFFPAVDNFRGNPLLMLFLEYDVRQMKDQTGMAAAYLRDRIRESFVDKATLTASTIAVAGKTLPARLIVVKPFAQDDRFKNLPAFRDKTYRFVVAGDAPGQIVALSADMPADAESGAPAWSEKIVFVEEKPE